MGKREKWIILILLVAAPFILRSMAGNFLSHDIEDVRKKIKEHLYERYGEEFVVDRIGTRSSRGEEFFQARIYPKSIVGTNKEGDDYYYASASVDKKPFGRLGNVGDGYGLTKINIGAEKYLLPKAREIFGEKVKLKPRVKYRIENDLGFYEWNKEPNFLEALQSLKEYPEERRIELDLEVYIFDRIEDDQEKESRRKQIFEFVQHLKKEGLYEYLELGITFIDDRVLAASYDGFKNKIRFSNKVKKKLDGETIELPSKELRKKMSKKLQKEIDKMNKEEIINRMNEIKKDELTYDNLREYHGQYYCWIYSIGMLKENYRSSITKEDRETTHDKLEDIKLKKYKKYIYINNLRRGESE